MSMTKREMLDVMNSTESIDDRVKDLINLT